MSIAALLTVLVAGWTIVELVRLRAATSRLERHRVDAALDVATGLLARRHGIMRFRVELRRARRAGRAITVHELRAPSASVMDALGAQLSATVTYPDIAIRVSPLEAVMLQSHPIDESPSAPRHLEVKSLGCELATRTVMPADGEGFVELERYVDEIEAREPDA